MPATTYTKLVEWREDSLTEQPQNPGGAVGAMHGAIRNAMGANPIPINRGGAPTPAPAPGGKTAPPQSNKLDLTKLLQTGKAYGIVFSGQYQFVVFYNETRRGWSVAVNRERKWELWGPPQTTLGKAFTQVGSGL